MNVAKAQRKFSRGRYHFNFDVAAAIAAGQTDMRGQHIQIEIFLLQPAAAKPAIIVTEGFGDFRRCFTKNELQMGRGVRRASGGLTAQAEVTDAMRSEIDNDFFPRTEFPVCQSGRRTAGIGAPAVDDSATLLSLVSSGFGATILPLTMIPVHMRSHVKTVIIEDNPFVMTPAVIWRKDSYLPKPVRQFLELF